MENTMTRIEALANDQDFVAKVTNTNSAEEMLAVMAEYDIHMTEEDLKAFLERIMMIPESGELNEEMLDNVSGGGRFWNWVKSCFNNWFHRQSEKNAREIGNIINNL